jgi:Flp pilus assembly protein TadG
VFFEGAMTRFQRLRRDESGMSYVFIGMGMMAFLSASMLAIDVGMLMTARAQAQNSADAGALAGATALVFDDYQNRTNSGPAKTNAVNAAKANSVMAKAVSVTPNDVSFENDETGQQNRVKVNVYRNAQHGNPVSTYIAKFFGNPVADIAATATAEASPANAMTCVKPFTVPDRWIERQTPPWDPDDTFDMYDSKGKLLANPDQYIPISSPDYTGYNAERDQGLRVVLKADNGSKLAPGIYHPYAPPDDGGGNDYRWNIAFCNQAVVPFGAHLVPEPGNMEGPTTQGMQDLIARDPSAYWDTSLNRVQSSMHPSPRVVAIPLFDPSVYETGKQTGRNADFQAVNYIGFFVEAMQGKQVLGRIVPIKGLRKGGIGPAPAAAFPKSIRLVK